MWWVKDHPDHSRGGFQNRDVGRTNFDEDYGPTYGVDYARFSDPPDLVKDGKLQKKVEALLAHNFDNVSMEIKVKNGFVILKGNVSDEMTREKIISTVRLEEGVVEIINQMTYET